MEQNSSSSNVTVEYFDPFNVYQLLSPGLISRLPLRNLHWESHSGPLRSIQSLYVDLVPSPENRPLSSQSGVPAASDLARVKSTDSNASGDDGFRTQTLGKSSVERADGSRPASRAGQTPFKGAFQARERRHQIPGLRQTPYLKVFFLRCDDNETYKSQRRKQVREWIKEYTISSTGSKTTAQENHDAFEWCIVHVIVPNTAAATQPRFTAKGGNTILEKLKADFNGTGKNSVDRVTQVRIGINDVPYDLLPRVIPAIPGSYTETPRENEEAWGDLVAKFKSLILNSFDSRVSQYEEDIREKDAQRTLPGWNFCTFFVLKEGLARGFESVGLVEDALVGYDELSVGLDAIIREQAAEGSEAQHGGSFLPCTADLRSQVEKEKAAILRESGIEVDEVDGPIDLQSPVDTSTQDADEIPLSANKKPYRDLILANNISVFDFRCYLFSRQLSLLLRMANAWSSRDELLAKLKELRESSLIGVAARPAPEKPPDDTEDLIMLGQVCKRALEFVASISRIMRQDLLASEAEQKTNASEKLQDGSDNIQQAPLVMQVINNVVSSFTFAVAQQILAQTSTTALPIPPSTLVTPMAQGQEEKAAIPEPKTMMHPVRSSSLTVITPREPASPGVFPGGRRLSISGTASSTSASTFLKPGLEELAARRAALYLLSRTVLERLGEQRGWAVGSNIINSVENPAPEMEEVDLNEDSAKRGDLKSEESSQLEPTCHGLTSVLLLTGLSTSTNFYRLYETLTDKALRHYNVASHHQSVQSCIADLAILKFHLEDYGAAASFFYRMTPFYGESGWEIIEIGMLVLYARCLRRLERKEEFVRVSIKLLERAATAEKDRLARRGALKLGPGSGIELGVEDVVSVAGYLTDLLTVVPTLAYEVSVPLQMFFEYVEVDSTVRYHEDRDSFALLLKMRYLLADDFKVEKVKVRIVPLIGGQGRDIWLETEEELLFKKGVVRLRVQSNVIISGTYVVRHIILQTSKMVLSYESEPLVPLSLHIGPKFFKCPRLLLYQRPETFNIRLFASRSMHLDRNRSVELEISSGWNDVQSGELHIRAATAGLRLQTSEVNLLNGNLTILKNSDPGVIRFSQMESGSKAKIRIPFSLETEVSDVAIKLESSYTTADGTFFFSSNQNTSILLPLGVNVQDVFKRKTLLSKFTISSASSSPLRLLSSNLGDSDLFAAHSGGNLRNPIVIFPRQPASLLYKIMPILMTKPVDSTGRTRKERVSLSLVIHYICLEEEIDNAVELSLQKALSDSPYRQYSRLIISNVVSQLRSRLSPYDFERTALISELPTSLLADIKWQEHFHGLGLTQLAGREEETAKALERWINEWRDQNKFIELEAISISQETIDKSRSIVIPVEVPSINVVHTVNLRLQRSSQSDDVVIVTNQPISASLKVRWTRTWDTDPPMTALPISHGSKDSESGLDFVYEISAPPESWLIGGKRKGHFTIPYSKSSVQETPLEFPILLIPIREGFLSFPHVDIKPMPIVKPADQKSAASTGEEEKDAVVTCETDYKNIAETVRVVSNARKITVSLDESGPQGGAWLLESEGRDKSAFVA